jgi:hypothetical protein
MIAMILVGTLASGAGAGAVAYSVAQSPSTKTVVRQVPSELRAHGRQQRADARPDLPQTYQGVVEITVSTPQQTPTGNQEAQAQGSGFVIDSDGHIVTNEHVVENAGLGLGPVLERQHLRRFGRRHRPVDGPRRDQGRRAVVCPSSGRLGDSSSGAGR